MDFRFVAARAEQTGTIAIKPLEREWNFDVVSQAKAFRLDSAKTNADHAGEDPSIICNGGGNNRSRTGRVLELP